MEERKRQAEAARREAEEEALEAAKKKAAQSVSYFVHRASIEAVKTYNNDIMHILCKTCLRGLGNHLFYAYYFWCQLY